MKKAQRWFILNRLLDDFAYHSVVRPTVQKVGREKGWNVYRLTDAQTQEIEALCRGELTSYAASQNFGLRNLTFDLPWNRTFEAEIDFELK